MLKSKQVPNLNSVIKEEIRNDINYKFEGDLG